MKAQKRVNLVVAMSFVVMIVFLSGITLIGFLSMTKTKALYQQTYNGAFQEWVQTEQAIGDLIAVHRAMKDVALSRNELHLQSALEQADHYDSKIQDYFAYMKNADPDNPYLAAVHHTYNDWAPIRQRTIDYAKNSEYELAAENTRAGGASQVLIISNNMQQLSDNQRAVADQAFANLQDISKESQFMLLLLGFVVICISAVTAIVVTRRLRLYQASIFEEKEKLQIMFSSIGDGIITTDLNQNITSMNKMSEIYTGWHLSEAVGQPFEKVFSITNEKTGQPAKNPVLEALTKDDVVELENHTLLTSKLGVVRHIADSAAPIKNDSNETTGIVMIFRDVTEQKNREDEILYLSKHDVLTGLYNRAHIDSMLGELDTEEYLPLSIIMADINGLKLINDAFGHMSGDKLIVEVSRMFKKHCRGDDIIARIGGDEFCVLLPKTPLEAAQQICDRIQAECKRYTSTSNKSTLYVSVALGCSTKMDFSISTDRIMLNAEEQMYKQKLLERTSMRSYIISTIRSSMSEKSHLTEEHEERLTELSKMMAAAMNLSPGQANELALLSSLHDVGKLGVDEHILNKTEALSDLEWAEIRKHPMIGYRIAQATPDLSQIADYILCHHEHWDGSGYPQGLYGDQIPLLSRIVAVVDAFDAMTQDRPYRKAMSVSDAVVEIERHAGQQFDPTVAAVFIRELSLQRDSVMT